MAGTAVALPALGAAAAGPAQSPQVDAARPPAGDGRVEETRKLIREVADSLKAKEAEAARVSPPRNWRPSRTPWGDPDLSGIYSNSDENGIPFERPAEFEGRRLGDITPEELAAIQRQRREQTIERAVELSEMPNPQLFWWETLNAKNSRPWLIQDPPDGSIPAMTSEGHERQAAREEARRLSGRGPADSYEDRSLYDRCISRGLPGSMLPAIYGSSYQIHQGPGYVAIRYEMIHETRIVPLGGGPHVDRRIRSYMGDARGRWDGTTLVVETTNFNDQIAYRGADGASLRLIERFTPTGPGTLEWAVTVDDPRTWVRPWTFAMTLTKRDQSQQPYEYACHEGNYGLRNILSAARAADREAAASGHEGTRPRVAPVPEAEWSPEQRDLAVRFGEGGAIGNDIRTYLRHPMLAANILPFERYISHESTLPARDRELLILRTAWLCQSTYVWAHHAPAARQAGMSTADLERIAQGPDAPGWNPWEASLLRAADELHTNAFVGEATWNALAARYDVRALMDAVFTVGEFVMVSEIVNSLGVQVESAFADRLPAGARPHPAPSHDDRLIGRSPRIAPLEPAEWTPDVRAWLERAGSGRRVAAVYRTYARHLALDKPRSLVSEHIRGTSTLPARVRELLILRIGWLCRSEYEWAAHAPAGRRAGLSDGDFQRIIAGPDSSSSTLDTALLRAVDELYRDDVVSDDTWSVLARQLDTKQMLDLLVTTGGYRAVSMALNSFGVPLEPNAERFPAAAAR